MTRKNIIIIILTIIALIALGVGQFLEIPWVEKLTIILSGIWLGVVLIGITIDIIKKGEGFLLLAIIGIAILIFLFFLLF